MKKKFYHSMTFWGAIVMSMEVFLKSTAVQLGIPANVILAIGSIITIFGLRRAMK